MPIGRRIVVAGNHVDGNAGIAQLLVDGTYSLLKQYRTASGYGYKNPIYDLRGKGQEATLTNLMDGKKTQLKEK